MIKNLFSNKISNKYILTICLSLFLTDSLKSITLQVEERKKTKRMKKRSQPLKYYTCISNRNRDGTYPKILKISSSPINDPNKDILLVASRTCARDSKNSLQRSIESGFLLRVTRL